MWDKLLRRVAEREEALYAIQCTSGLEWTEAQLDRLGALVERRKLAFRVGPKYGRFGPGRRHATWGLPGYWSAERPTPYGMWLKP